MRIALGSSRAAKIAAVRASAARVASIETSWVDAEIIALEVSSNVPAMPLTDDDLLRGAMARALAVRQQMLSTGTLAADLYVGLEGGFHSIDFSGQFITFLRGWAYVTDGARASFGASPSIVVPENIVRAVADSGRELAEVIDQTAGQQDVRSRQGAWGVLSRDLFTRSMSFEVALVAAFAPFYNAGLYR